MTDSKLSLAIYFFRRIHFFFLLSHLEDPDVLSARSLTQKVQLLEHFFLLHIILSMK